MAAQVLPKKELMRIIKRFLADERRGISQKLFAEIAGISETTLKDVFMYEKIPMSETTQRRVSKAYEHWRKGDVAIMELRDRTRVVEYRKESKPRLAKGYGLQVQGGEIKLKLGIRNKAEYDETLDEQLRGY
jgi:hypothetical protein